MSQKEKTEDFNPRLYMEMAIEAMHRSIQEPRSDKTSPKVGAVLIKPDGTVETGFRGELRHGDHAEFTVLERKNRSTLLDGSILFVTLEPCAPGSRKHPKLACAERILNARISRVWIGIEDPDPTVDRKGIKYLQDHGVEVEMFYTDLQEQIREANAKFIEEAEERAKRVQEVHAGVVLSPKEKLEPRVESSALSNSVMQRFVDKAKLNVSVGSSQLDAIMIQLGLLIEINESLRPTGVGLLLFGTRPQFVYHHALIRATFRTDGRDEEIDTFEGPLADQIIAAVNWCEKHIPNTINRSTAERTVVHEYPIEILREAVINAVAHRDYDIEGAAIQLEINDDAIIIKSPGEPVKPITIEQIKRFSAPSLSRNPKIMYVLNQMGLVEQRGLGFKSMKSLPDKYKLPLPRVTYEAPYLILTLPRSEEGLKNISETPNLSDLNSEELMGFEYIKQRGTINRRMYEEQFGFDKKKAERHLNKMFKLGLIQRIGQGPSTEYRAIET